MILNDLQGVDLSILVGLGFDGSSSTKGYFSGDKAVLYIQCENLCLNLAINISHEDPTTLLVWNTISRMLLIIARITKAPYVY